MVCYTIYLLSTIGAVKDEGKVAKDVFQCEMERREEMTSMDAWKCSAWLPVLNLYDDKSENILI